MMITEAFPVAFIMLWLVEVQGSNSGFLCERYFLQFPVLYHPSKLLPYIHNK